jgi:type II secretion system protein G
MFSRSFGLLIVFLIAGCSGPGELTSETAEETFQKIRETLHNAATVKVTVKSLENGREVPGFIFWEPPSGSLLLKNSNKVRMGAGAHDGPKKDVVVFTSNGTKMAAYVPNAAKCVWVDVPKDLREIVETALLGWRLPEFERAFRLLFGGSVVDRTELFHNRFYFDGFKAVREDVGEKSLAYRVGEKQGQSVGGSEVFLWYEAKSFKLLRGSISWVNMPRWTSTFEVAFNVELPDELFTLPAEDLDPARIAKTKVDLATIRRALDEYAIDNGHYPTTQQGLIVLYRETVTLRAKRWKGPYVASEEILLDPWGHPYSYRHPRLGVEPSGYDLSSWGPDGKPGTGDDIDH